MKAKTKLNMGQPAPFTPGITRTEVREHAYRMFRDRLPDRPLTLEDWVLAEKDLVDAMHAETKD